MTQSSVASLEWEKTTINFTVHPLQAEKTVNFHFTNTGDESITILALKPGCGCISGKVDKKTYAPNESGVVHVTFNLANRLGAQRKGIEVKTSDSPIKPTKLYVGTTIPKTYIPSVKRLVWATGEAHKAKSCRIINVHKEAFQLAKAVPHRKGLEVELKTIRKGYEYELIVKPTADLKRALIPIFIHPAKLKNQDKLKTFIVYVLVK